MSKINERIEVIVGKSGLTKTAFAEKINVTQQHVSRLTKDGTPSDRTIADICDKFGVNETWLRTGEGTMYREISEQDQLAAMFNSMITEDVPYRNEIILCLSRMTPAEWKLVGDKILEIAEEIKREKE